MPDEGPLPDKRPAVLIVDDQIANLRLLSDTLK
jgi:hypothetical protein